MNMRFFELFASAVLSCINRSFESPFRRRGASCGVRLAGQDPFPMAWPCLSPREFAAYNEHGYEEGVMKIKAVVLATIIGLAVLGGGWSAGAQSQKELKKVPISPTRAD